MNFLSKRMSGSMLRVVIPSIGALMFVVFSSWILLEASKATVAVTQNGEKQTLKTHANTVKELLDDLGIVVGQHDVLSYAMNTTLENGMDIDYKQAKKVSLTIDGVEQEHYTTVKTVEKFLAAKNIIFSDHDVVSHEDAEPIVEGLHVLIKTAFEVTINDGGKENQVWTTGGSIKQLLATNEVSLSKIDKIKPALDKDVDKDTLIAITRVEKKADVIEESVAFSTETKADSSLAKGKEEVISKGQKGTVVKTYEVTKENGKEVSRKIVNEEVKKESKNKVVAIGTKESEQSNVTVVNKPKNDSSNSNSGGKEFFMNATAFTAQCNGCSGVTATGINLNANPNMKVIAVDPNVIPLGTKVWVEGYGNAIAGDTGGSIKGNRIDAHVPTKAEAYSFGRKKVKVKIIE